MSVLPRSVERMALQAQTLVSLKRHLDQLGHEAMLPIPSPLTTYAV
jgi:hypothetical protein